MVESCVYDVINLKNKSNKEENNYFVRLKNLECNAYKF